MKKVVAMEQLESVMRKITWAQEIISMAQEHADTQVADILSGATFIIDSASQDAEELYKALQ